jgi:Sigma-70 region 2
MPESKQVLVGRIFEEHLIALRAIFRRRVRSQPQAADLAQEVYVRMLQVKDMGAIRDPQAYLFSVARNLAHEHAFQQRRAQFAVDVEEAGVQAELAEVPNFGTQIDTARRSKKAGGVVQASGEATGRGRDGVLARPELRANRATTGRLDPYGPEIPESGARDLPASHGAIEMNGCGEAARSCEASRLACIFTGK